MKKLIIITLLFSNFSSFSFDDGSAKIIKKYLKAIGGAKEWEAVKTIKTVRHIDEKSSFDFTEVIFILKNTGYRAEHLVIVGSPILKGYYNNEAWGVSNPIGIWNSKNSSDSISLKNNKSYQKKEVLFNHDNGMEISFKKNSYDTVSFKNVKINQKNQIRDIDNKEAQFLRWQTQTPWNFINYETNGYRAIYKGDSKISVDEVSEVEMISNKGDTIRYFFNQKTYLLLKVICKNMEVMYSDYKQIGNVKMPYGVVEAAIDHRFPHSDRITPRMTWYTIDQVKLNEPMDEKIFMKPKQ